MVEGTETNTEAAALERILVTGAQVDAIPASKVAIISTLVQNLTLPTFQDIPATPSTTKTLLLLTTGQMFDRTVAKDAFDFAKSSTAHIEKLPSEKPFRT